MTLTSWLSLVAICVLGALSPGPSLAVVLKQSMNNDAKHGMVAGISHAMGVGLWAVLTIFGLGVLVSESPLLFSILTYAGAAYLAWMGVQALRAGKSEVQPLTNGRSEYLQAARDGLMISLLNPKLAIFFLALFSQFISADDSIADQLLMISTVTIIDGCWYVLVALVLSRMGLLQTLANHSQLINKITGVFFIALAVRVITL
ncbi:LysE family translocator [Bacterioplanoides sp.]|uniref:LysE family translocator n=1 Tax=Bacterioplanoides sp. TaxID=2066072 RepID=UPI003B5BCFF2